MSSKQLTILATILLVLAGLVYFKNSGNAPPSIEDEVELVTLLPDGIGKADITKLKLSNGGAPDDVVELTRDSDDPDVWRITSLFDAPAKTDTIETYVGKIVGLKGEPRSRNQDDAGLANYNLTPEKAFHVAGFKQGDTEPAFNILVGKSPDASQVFMRPEGGKDVLVFDVDLRQEAGVFADGDPSAAPEHGHWLDKSIAAIEMESIDSLRLETSEKNIVFEKVEKAVEPEAPDEGEPEDDPTESPEPAVEYEWQLKDGGPGGKFKQAGLDNWLRAFGSVNATDVVDPSTPADWGLEEPAFKLVVGVSDQDEDVVIEAGRPDMEGEAYARLAGNDGVVYTVAKYNFERVFPKGTDLFDLPTLTVATETINRIELRQSEGNVVLDKVGEDWAVTEPVLDLNVQASAAGGIAAALATWRASDYADGGVDAGFAGSGRSVTFSTTDGERHTVALGNDSMGVEGAYAKLDDSADVLVMSQSDIGRVFKAPKDFYELTVLDVFDDEIQSIQVDRPEDGFELARNGEGWTIDYGAGPKPAVNSMANDLALAIADFQATDILMGVASLAGIPTATITTTMNEGTEHRFAFRAVPDDDSRFEFAYSGKALVFGASGDDVNELLPSSDSLRAPEPEEPVAEDTPMDEVAPDVAATTESPASAEADTPVEPDAADSPESDDAEPASTEDTAEPSADAAASGTNSESDPEASTPTVQP